MPDRHTIAILSRNRFLYATRRLAVEIERCGAEAIVVDPLRGHIDADGFLRAESGEAIQAQACLARPSRDSLAAVMRLQSALITTGCEALASTESLHLLRDKASTAMALRAAGVQTLPTIVAGPGTTPATVIDSADRAGWDDVVIKLPDGAGGAGTMRATGKQQMRQLLEAMQHLQLPCLIQRFVEEAQGRDFRLIVLQGSILASAQREAAPGDFRANVHRDGSMLPAACPDDIRFLALDAARALGSDFCGVDILPTRDGPMVLEVNASPGLRGIEEATATNIAALIAGALERLARGQEKSP